LSCVVFWFKGKNHTLTANVHHHHDHNHYLTHFLAVMELACSSSSSGLPSSSCADSSSSSCASSISGSKTSKNGISTSLRRLSVPHSLSEAKAVTKSALKAGKYRVKETSRDLWTRTKKETKGAKKKSKELVSLSTDLLSSLSLRVQEKINGSSPRHGGIIFKKGGRESSSDANLDGSCCDEEEYCWDSDFSDTSYDSTDCDHSDVVSFDQRRLHPKNSYNHENIYENDEEEGEEEDDDDMPCVEGEVAGADTAIESRGRRRMKVNQVECMSMRKINDDFVADNVLVGKSDQTTKEGMRQDLQPNQHLPHIEEQRKILMHGLSLHLKKRNLHQNSKDDQSKDQGLISLQQQHQQPPPSHLSSQTPSFSTTGTAYTITTTGGGKGRLEGEVDHVKRKEEMEKRDQDKRLLTSTTTTSRTVKSSSLLQSTSSTTDAGRRDVSLPEDQLEMNGSTDNDRLGLRPPRPPPPSSFPSLLLSTSFLSTNSPSSPFPLSPDHRYQREVTKTSSSLQEENEKQQQQHESIDSKMNQIAMMKKVVPPKPKLPLPPKPTLPFLHLKCSPVHQHHLSSSPYQSSNTSSPDSNQQTHLHNDYHQEHQPTVAKITTLNNVPSQGSEEDAKDRMECRESKIGQEKAGPFSPSKTADNSVQEKFRNHNQQQMMKDAASLGLRASSSSSLTSSTTPQASSANNNNSRPSSVTGVTGCKRGSRIERPKEQPPPPPIPPPLPKTSPPPLTDDLQEELVVSFVSSDLPSSSSSPTNTTGITSPTTTLVSSPDRKASCSSSLSNSVSASFTTSRLHNSINGGHKTTDGIKNTSTATTTPNGTIKDVKEGNDAGGVRKESPSSLRTGIPSSCKTTPRKKSPPSSSPLLQDEVRKSPEKKDKHPESASRKVNCDVERIIPQQHAHDNGESIPTSPGGKSRETLMNDKDIKRYDTVERCRRQQQQYRQEERDDSKENNGIPEKEGSTRGEENEEEASSSSSSSFEEMMSAKSSLSSQSLHVDDEEDDEDEGKNATGENNRQDVLFDEDILSEGSYEVPDESCPWFRPDLTRAAAEKYLFAPDRTEGSFVVRPGSSPIFPFSLSLLSEGRVYHLNIRKHDGVSKTCFSLGKSPTGRVFDSLKDLVSHYTNKPLLLVSTKHLNNNNNMTPNSNNYTNPSSSSISIHPPKKYVCLVLQVNNLHPPSP